jgi:cell division protein FtsB
VNVDLGIWSKLTRLVIFLLCVAGVLGVAVWYLPVIKQNERLRRQILKLDAQITKAEDNNRALNRKIESLRYDPRAVERLARERLSYARPNETVIRFEPVGVK